MSNEILLQQLKSDKMVNPDCSCIQPKRGTTALNPRSTIDRDVFSDQRVMQLISHQLLNQIICPINIYMYEMISVILQEKGFYQYSVEYLYLVSINSIIYQSPTHSTRIQRQCYSPIAVTQHGRPAKQSSPIKSQS